MNRQTIFSPCRRYRYTLWREWPCDMLQAYQHDYLMVIGLNPSTADETKDDPTIRRCIGFAKAWGFGALCMTNLFAFRATQPKDMKAAEEPIGLDNGGHLVRCAKEAGMVLAAWGAHGNYREQDSSVKRWLGDAGVKLHCLVKNADGSPKHPLYVAADTMPTLL